MSLQMLFELYLIVRAYTVVNLGGEVQLRSIIFGEMRYVNTAIDYIHEC